MNCLIVFDHFVGLVLKRLTIVTKSYIKDARLGSKYVSAVTSCSCWLFVTAVFFALRFNKGNFIEVI